MVRILSEPSALDLYGDYLRQVEPRSESRAVRAMFRTGDTRIKNLHGLYVEVYGSYQVMLNVDGISIYTKTNITKRDRKKTDKFGSGRT